MDRKKIFFTSDWHLGHANSILYDKRPFSDTYHMAESLINRYNNIVPEDGVCYFLGDMGMDTDHMQKVINRLNGTKILIAGNHDKTPNTMYRCGFDVVMYGATLYIAKCRVTLSHCPLLGVFREDTKGMKGAMDGENWHGESRMKTHHKYTTKDEGQFHLHGHIHSSPTKGCSERILGRQFDVGVTANNYTPVTLSRIETWINRTKG